MEVAFSLCERHDAEMPCDVRKRRKTLCHAQPCDGLGSEKETPGRKPPGFVDPFQNYGGFYGNKSVQEDTTIRLATPARR
jgi:hypothetical protein